MSNDQYTRLTQADLRALEAQIEAEISALPPLEDNLSVSWRAKALGAIASAGAIITLAIVEFARSFGAIIIAVLFAVLEFSRVQAGAMALGLADSKAVLIAIAIVSANVIHPIYAIRAHAKIADLHVTRHTARGIFANIGNRLFSPSSTRKVDNTHNATLSASAFIITITTVFLAIYDVLSPLITQLATGQITTPVLILITELIMGMGIAIGGVLMLQAIAHELAISSFSFDTRSSDEILAEARAQRNAQIAEIRENVKLAYMTAKIQDEQRKKAGAGNGTVQAIAPVVSAIGNEGDEQAHHTTNGKGNHADFLAPTPNGAGGYPHQNGASD